MTLLNWELSPSSVIIFSDTLSLAADSKLPKNFMTKVYPVPHMGGVITGTGLGEVIARFVIAANGRIVASDIEHLSEFAPDVLRDIWKEFETELPAGATTTIYTFGLVKSGEFGGFAYRSTSDFHAEVLQHGTAAKPAPSMDQLAAVQDLSDFVQLAFQHQSDDRALPRLERVGIGGDLWLYILGKAEDGSLVISTNRIVHLQHAKTDHELILAQLPANLGHPYLASLLSEALGG